MEISTGNKYIYLLFLCLFAFILSIYFLPELPRQEKEYYSKNTAALKEGKMLSEKYCSSCHLYPEPSLLPQKTWSSSVLPAMGPMMGIFNHRFDTYPTETDPHLPPDFYPPQAQLSQTEWQKIIDYYEEAAPVEFKPRVKEKNIIAGDFSFAARAPSYRAKQAPKVTAVRFDVQNQLIYAADANLKRLLVFDKDLQLINTISASAPVSDIRLTNIREKSGSEELLVTLMGHLLPADRPSGSIETILPAPSGDDGYESHSLLIDSLARPAESKFTDLNQNGIDDLLVSEFGHRTGHLFWSEDKGEGFSAEKHILADSPGCLETEVTDFNGDGLPDVLALCTQADQAIYFFVNQGEGDFIQKELMRFHIAAGSSSFELHDFNGDGHPDILYTSGDNADYSTIPKPYHGVYIYMNDGANKFTKQWFYPLHGAFNARASDFNKDGKPDIAVISFYAEYEKHPEEGFVFFKNEGGLTFTPYHHPAASGGRWITMDVADWTNDGYEDVLLGNFSEGFLTTTDSLQAKWLEGPHFLLLENQHGVNRN